MIRKSLIPSVVLVCGLALFANPTAADVCQQGGGPFRIKVVRKSIEDGYSFQICYANAKDCAPLGDKISYKWEDIDDVRLAELKAGHLPSDEKQDAAVASVFFIAALAGVDPSPVGLSAVAHNSTMGSASTPGSEQLANAALHKENAEALKNDYLSTADACVDVPSIEKYKEALVRILTKVPGTMVDDHGNLVKVFPAVSQAAAVKARPTSQTAN